jgi:hypothetical protein
MFIGHDMMTPDLGGLESHELQTIDLNLGWFGTLYHTN